MPTSLQILYTFLTQTPFARVLRSMNARGCRAFKAIVGCIACVTWQ